MRIQKISFHSCQFKKHILKNDFEKLKDKIISTFKKKKRAYTFHSTEEPQGKEITVHIAERKKQKKKN